MWYCLKTPPQNLVPTCAWSPARSWYEAARLAQPLQWPTQDAWVQLWKPKQKKYHTKLNKNKNRKVSPKTTMHKSHFMTTIATTKATLKDNNKVTPQTSHATDWNVDASRSGKTWIVIMYDFSVTNCWHRLLLWMQRQKSLIWHRLHILSTAINHEVKTLLTND